VRTDGEQSIIGRKRKDPTSGFVSRVRKIGRQRLRPAFSQNAERVSMSLWNRRCGARFSCIPARDREDFRFSPDNPDGIYLNNRANIVPKKEEWMDEAAFAINKERSKTDYLLCATRETEG
jgi:hypothetical protein